MILGASILAGLLTARLLFHVFFADMDDFCECVRYYLTPDWLSRIRGEYIEDFLAQTKLIVYVALCAAVGFGLYYELGGKLPF